MKKILCLVIISVIFGCAPDPIPQDQKVYVGIWQGSNIFLEIDADGNASYAKVMEGASETVDSPVKKIGDGKIVIGYLFITKTLELTKPPFEEDGKWKMVIDGVTLTKQTTL
jgi:hypothetical protein